MKPKENFRKLDLKRKYHCKVRRSVKRFKRAHNLDDDFSVEKSIAKQKSDDIYHFSDSEPEDDLGMGIEISDLPFLCEQNSAEKQKQLVALTQDSVRPLFADEASYDVDKVQDVMSELKYTSYRPLQEEAIKRILLGQSTLFVSPTGSGKSLCYQIPAILYWRFRKYITIVVSPLISLMEDQLNNFPKAIRAVSLHSGHSKAQRQNTIESLIRGDAQVVFLSPEALVGGILTLEDLKNLPPVGFVCIDEAHCLSEWSHHFRPAYLQFFNILHDQLNIKTCLGLTATSTRSTSLTIAAHLHIDPNSGIIGSTNVPENLMLSVSCETNKELALINLLQSPTFKILSSIIVYCNRREDTDKLASAIRTAMQRYSTLIEAPSRQKKLSEQNDGSLDSSAEEKQLVRLTWHTEAYHAGISMEKRKQIQRKFVKGEIRVIVATIAFGMGINKSNVRAIVHYDMPNSFESYVQEIGRAGRDNRPAQCHMFISKDQTDLYYQQRNIYSSFTEHKNLKKFVDHLFPHCRCSQISTKEERDELDKLNKMESNSTHPSQDGIEQESNNCDIIEKENTTHAIGSAIIRKHRHCKGHEIAIPVEQLTQEMDLSPESIITLICRLKKVFPQLKIDLYTPTQPMCKLVCLHGPQQLKSLIEKNLLSRIANRLYLKTLGSNKNESNRIVFNLFEVAKLCGIGSREATKQLKQLEWDLDDETGRYKRSHIKVSFSGHSLHLKLVTDLDACEKTQVCDYLKEFLISHAKRQRLKIYKVFNLFQQYSLPMDKMGDKVSRVDISCRLKTALNDYFQLVDHDQQPSNDGLIARQKLDSIQEQLVRRRIRSFISAHGTNHSYLSIARVLQGVSSPNYPAEVWGTNRKWWRCSLDLDFENLSNLVKEELLLASTNK